jgi:nucleoid-associated protein YgaU
VTRELKLALIVGFALVLVVTVLISDHLSHARQTELAGNIPAEPIKAAEPPAIAMGNDSFNDSAPVPDTVNTPAPNAPAPAVTEPAAGSEPMVLTQASRSGNPAATATPAPGPGGEHTDLIREINRQGGTVHGDTIVLNPGTPAVKTVQETLPQDMPHGIPSVTPHTPPVVTPAPAKTPDTTYTVAAGDSFYKISRQYYNDGKVWRKLAKYNKMDEHAQLKVGTKLNIPSSEVLLGKKAVVAVVPTSNPTPTSSAKHSHSPSTAGIMLTGSGGPVNLGSSTPAPTSAKGHTYTVKKGDTLAMIAQHELGSSKRAHEIVELNKKTIKDPDNVPLGAVLTLPA